MSFFDHTCSIEHASVIYHLLHRAQYKPLTEDEMYFVRHSIAALKLRYWGDVHVILQEKRVFWSHVSSIDFALVICHLVHELHNRILTEKEMYHLRHSVAALKIRYWGNVHVLLQEKSVDKGSLRYILN